MAHGHGAQPPRRVLTSASTTPRSHRPALLSLLIATALANTGSAFIPLPVHGASAMSTDGNSNPGTAGPSTSSSKPLAASEGDAEPSQDCAEGEGAALQLPEASNDPSIPSIKLGESIRFEEMGPVIINPDGSTRRIDNWEQMTEQEQKVAWRRISKRNEQRRKALLEQQTQQENDAEGKES